MGTILLLLLAIAPPAALTVLIYWMDRHEPESLKNVIISMLIGAMSTIPAILIQLAFDSAPLFTLPGLTGRFYEAFLLTAPSEEMAKFLFIYLFIRKKPFYSEITDGIVYYGAGALGFALLENIFYVLDHGFSVGMLRAFTSIPIHGFCGIIIGYHAGLARFRDQLKPKRLILRGLFLAYLTHALYNTLASADSLLTLLFIPLVAVIYYAIYKILRRGRQLSVAGNQAAQSVTYTSDDAERTSSEPESTYINTAALSALSVKPPVAPAAAGSGYSHAFPITNYRPEDIVTDSDSRKYLVPKKETWKIIISRILLISIGLLWLLFFYGADTPPNEVWDLVFGMILLTIIPFMIGLLLEVSYQRRKRRKIYVDDRIADTSTESAIM